jgi:hypothetical protein
LKIENHAEARSAKAGTIGSAKAAGGGRRPERPEF